MKRVALAAALALAAHGAAEAQQRQERAPRETVTAMLFGKKVAVEYGRPALGGRDMGALLSQLPADRIWRAGVDQATTLTADSDIIVGGKRVKAGKYTVYVHAPETGDYSLVLNSDPGVPLKTIFPAAPPELADALWPRLGDYETVKAKEVIRVPLKRSTAAEKMDRFLIGLQPAKDGVSAITLTWGDRVYTTDIRAAEVPAKSGHLSLPPIERAALTVGGSPVTITYGSPALGGRTVAGLLDTLKPDRIWRAGIHHPTTLTIEKDLTIGGRRLRAGRYTLFVHAPATGDYSLVVNSANGVPDDYKDALPTEVLRAPMRRGKTPATPLESFVIESRPAGNGAATLSLAWGDQRWDVDMSPVTPN